MKINVYRNTSQFYILYKKIKFIYIKISYLSFDTTIHLNGKNKDASMILYISAFPNEIRICELSPFDFFSILINSVLQFFGSYVDKVDC